MFGRFIPRPITLMAEGLREKLAEEALCVKNFLEDYWQFNEIFADLKGQHPSPGHPIRMFLPVPGSTVKRYACGYPPGHHCFDSCVSACKVPTTTPNSTCSRGTLTPLAELVCR